MTDTDRSTEASVPHDPQAPGCTGSKRNARGEPVDPFREPCRIARHRDSAMSIEDRYYAAGLDLDGALDCMLAICKRPA